MNTKSAICGSKPTRHRKQLPDPIVRRTPKTTTSGSRSTNMCRWPSAPDPHRQPSVRPLRIRPAQWDSRAVRIDEEHSMTWIKTVTMDEDQRVKKATEAQRQLYPVEYATP